MIVLHYYIYVVKAVVSIGTYVYVLPLASHSLNDIILILPDHTGRGNVVSKSIACVMCLSNFPDHILFKSI